MGALTDPSLLVAIALMFIGGASGSTAGGVKVATFAILLATIVSTARGRTDTVAFGRRVSPEVIGRGLSVALLSVATVFAGTLAMTITGATADVLSTGFEVVSAFGTVGHTANLTPTLPPASLLVLVATMFIGRLGPLTLILAVAARTRPVPYRAAAEPIRIG
jgi:trk system potassium uptake protein TrkH